MHGWFPRVFWYIFIVFSGVLDTTATNEERQPGRTRGTYVRHLELVTCLSQYLAIVYHVCICFKCSISRDTSFHTKSICASWDLTPSMVYPCTLTNAVVQMCEPCVQALFQSQHVPGVVEQSRGLRQMEHLCQKRRSIPYPGMRVTARIHSSVCGIYMCVWFARTCILCHAGTSSCLSQFVIFVPSRASCFLLCAWVQMAKYGAEILEEGCRSSTIRAIQREFGLHFGKEPSLSSCFNLTWVDVHHYWKRCAPTIRHRVTCLVHNIPQMLTTYCTCFEQTSIVDNMCFIIIERSFTLTLCFHPTGNISGPWIHHFAMNFL